MKNSKLYIIFFFILLLVNKINAQAEIIKVPSELDKIIETFTESLIKQSNIPGISMAISKNGSIIYAKGFGYADVKNVIKMTPKTQIRTASVAKVITATAIGRLLSEGKLDIDLPIKAYIPYIDKQYENLTSRQLAAHSSGLNHRPNGNSYKKKQYSSIQETVELMNAPLLFTPDTDYKYSTHAYNLLAAVIEGASGMTYLEYLHQKVFKPLNMTQTFAENINELSDKDSEIYYVKNGKLKKENLTNASYKIPGAGFRSTPTDLVHMMNAYSNGLLSDETVNELFKSHQLKNGEQLNVGVAWRSSIDAFGNKVIEHAGSWLGARTVVVYYPEQQLSISLMVNSSCQLLIEETAHMYAHLFLTNQIEEPSITNLEQTVELTFYSEKEEHYTGNLSFNNHIGLLETNNDGFLKSNPIYYLGTNDDYVLVTSYGLIYLNLETNSKTVGNLYLYFNRLSENPRKSKPMVIFKTSSK